MAQSPDLGLLGSSVAALLQSIGDDHIRPAFGNLRAEQISGPPTDLVTEVDRAVESVLLKVLAELLPEALFLGEERQKVDPLPIDCLLGPRPVWVVDPLDGTHFFASGRPTCSVQVALTMAGCVVGGWIHAPLLGISATAVSGSGLSAWGDTASLALEHGAVRPVLVPDPTFYTQADIELVDRLDQFGWSLRPTRSAGLDYLSVALGRVDAAVFTWDKPWDHLAGRLIALEAGKLVADRTGDVPTIVRPRLPMVAAASRSVVNDLLNCI